MKFNTWFLVVGVLLLVGGVLALANPFAASLAVTSLVGIFLLIGGAFQLWAAFSGVAFGSRGMTGLLGLLALVAGIFLLANPLEGVVSLTLVVGVVFLFTGLGRLLMAWGLRQTPLFWMLVLSGAISTLLGAFVISDLMGAASVLLGLMLAIELIADGVSLIVLGVIGRKMWK